MKKILSVAAIAKGTVIDHIFSGKALKIIDLLKFVHFTKTVTVGIHLPSKSMGYKDLIKIEDRFINEDEASKIAILAPLAKINIIENYQVIKKFNVTLPQRIDAFFKCCNPMCITNHEKITTSFLIEEVGKKVFLHCRYCQKRFFHDSD